MMGGMPERLKPGDELTTGWLNKLLSLARSCRINLGVNSGLAMVRNEHGTFLRVTARGSSGQLAITTGTITARSGTTAGTGSVYPVATSISGGACTLTTGATSMVVFNFSGTSGGIATGKYCWIDQDPYGTWFIVSVEC